MIFRWDFIGKGRFCLYLWAQVYCLLGRATVRADLLAMDAVLQAQTLSMTCLHRGRRLRIHRLVTCVFTGRTNCVFTQVIACIVTGHAACAFTGYAACAATLGRPRAPQHGTQSRSQSPRSSQTSTRRPRTPTHRRRALGKAAIRLQLALSSSPTHQPPRRTPHHSMGTTHHPLHRNPLHVGPVRVEQQERT